MVQIDKSDHVREGSTAMSYYNATDSYAFYNVPKHSQGITFEIVLFLRFHFGSTPLPSLQRHDYSLAMDTRLFSILGIILYCIF